ncbi:uncharacterized protein BXZ73DRAFT_104296 [Epithele typhae]|uniref:uncharacterized protein n=1 Tax=Epithele typhae TaxID=378194 RepID=UPI0020087A90|nr:uncharacterized protein BXZ73DRAFT_104296 [Epithele typhae]KAH9921677.1 hypothetical protein BXZ73DRAFT_104296 [Epithele typhae]
MSSYTFTLLITFIMKPVLVFKHLPNGTIEIALLRIPPSEKVTGMLDAFWANHSYIPVVGASIRKLHKALSVGWDNALYLEQTIKSEGLEHVCAPLHPDDLVRPYISNLPPNEAVFIVDIPSTHYVSAPVSIESPASQNWETAIHLMDVLSVMQHTMFDKPGSLIVREEYVKLWESIMSHPKDNFIVFGHPGIGKTLFLYYALLRGLRAGLTILFCVRPKRFFLFGDKDVKVLASDDLSEVPENVLALVDATLAKPHDWLGEIHFRAVLSTSRRRALWKDFAKFRKPLLWWVMSYWSWEETGLFDVGRTPEDEAYYSAVELASVFGPSPRAFISKRLPTIQVANDALVESFMGFFGNPVGIAEDIFGFHRFFHLALRHDAKNPLRDIETAYIYRIPTPPLYERAVAAFVRADFHGQEHRLKTIFDVRAFDAWCGLSRTPGEASKAT